METPMYINRINCYFDKDMRKIIVKVFVFSILNHRFILKGTINTTLLTNAPKLQNLKLQNLKLQNLKLQNLKLQNLKLQNFKLQNFKLQNFKLQNFAT